MARLKQADITAMLGASGSGKSYATVKRLADHRGPALVWDPLAEHEGRVITSSTRELVRETGRGLVVYRPHFEEPKKFSRFPRQFDFFCRLAYQTGGLLVVVEELKFVTTPSYAPPAWSALNMQGRHQGLRILGTSQRPAIVDKDFLGNCTRIRCGRLTYPKDARVVAEVIQVDPKELLTMPDWHAVVWERGQLRREAPKPEKPRKTAQKTAKKSPRP